jgi:hypothetical protein
VSEWKLLAAQKLSVLLERRRKRAPVTLCYAMWIVHVVYNASEKNIRGLSVNKQRKFLITQMRKLSAEIHVLDNHMEIFFSMIYAYKILIFKCKFFKPLLRFLQFIYKFNFLIKNKNTFDNFLFSFFESKSISLTFLEWDHFKFNFSTIFFFILIFNKII